MYTPTGLYNNSLNLAYFILLLCLPSSQLLEKKNQQPRIKLRCDFGLAWDITSIFGGLLVHLPSTVIGSVSLKSTQHILEGTD